MATITNAADLLAMYAQGERHFPGANLYGADLSGANLYDADLSGANLCDANLRGANLYDADLYGADLRRANLCDADLRGADLYDADLYDADLRGANLRGANLRGANLSGANLDDANLYDANLHNVRNPSHESHEFIAEVLRQAAGDSIERRMVAGLVLVSHDLCWLDFGQIAREWTADMRSWVGTTLGVYENFRARLRYAGFPVGGSNHQTADKTNADGQQADAGGTPSPQEAAEAAEWMAPESPDLYRVLAVGADSCPSCGGSLSSITYNGAVARCLACGELFR